MHGHHLREGDHVKEDQMDLRGRLLNKLADSTQGRLRCRRKICIDTEQDSLIHGSHRLFVGLITFFWLRSTLYSIKFASNLHTDTVYLFWNKEARNRTDDT